MEVNGTLSVNKKYAYVYQTTDLDYTPDENVFIGNDSQTIQAAIDYLNVNGGGVCIINEGEYKINGTASTGSDTTGGMNALKLYSGISLFGINHVALVGASNNPASAIISIYGSEVNIIHDITINNIVFGMVDGAKTQNAIYCMYGDRININECVFEDEYSKSTLHLENSTNVRMISSLLSNASPIVNALSSKFINLYSIGRVDSGYIGFDNTMKFDTCDNVTLDGISLVSNIPTKPVYFYNCLNVNVTETNLTNIPVNVDNSYIVSFNEFSSEFVNINIDYVDDTLSLVTVTNSSELFINSSKFKDTYIGIRLDTVYSGNISGVGFADCTKGIDMNACSIMNISNVEFWGHFEYGIIGQTCSNCALMTINEMESDMAVDYPDDYRTSFDQCMIQFTTSTLINLINISGIRSKLSDINLVACTYCLISMSTFKECQYSGTGNRADATVNNQIV